MRLDWTSGGAVRMKRHKVKRPTVDGGAGVAVHVLLVAVVVLAGWGQCAGAQRLPPGSKVAFSATSAPGLDAPHPFPPLPGGGGGGFKPVFKPKPAFPTTRHQVQRNVSFYYVFPQLWPNGYCMAAVRSKCDKLPLHFPADMWTVRGLWVAIQESGKHLRFCKRADHKAKPISAQHHIADQPHMSSQMSIDLDRIWPSLEPGSEPANRWLQEWQTHGICTGLGEDGYFGMILNLHQQFSLYNILGSAGIYPDDIYTFRATTMKRAIRQVHGFDAELYCRRRRLSANGRFAYVNILQEIHFCFDVDLHPIDCPARNKSVPQITVMHDRPFPCAFDVLYPKHLQMTAPANGAGAVSQPARHPQVVAAPIAADPGFRQGHQQVIVDPRLSGGNAQIVSPGGHGQLPPLDSGFGGGGVGHRDPGRYVAMPSAGHVPPPPGRGAYRPGPSTRQGSHQYGTGRQAAGPPPADYRAGPPPADYRVPPPADYRAPPPADYGAPRPADYGAPRPADYGAPPPAGYGSQPPADYGSVRYGQQRPGQGAYDPHAGAHGGYPAGGAGGPNGSPFGTPSGGPSYGRPSGGQYPGRSGGGGGGGGAHYPSYPGGGGGGYRHGSQQFRTFQVDPRTGNGGGGGAGGHYGHVHGGIVHDHFSPSARADPGGAGKRSHATHDPLGIGNPSQSGRHVGVPSQRGVNAIDPRASFYASPHGRPRNPHRLPAPPGPAIHYRPAIVKRSYAHFQDRIPLSTYRERSAGERQPDPTRPTLDVPIIDNIVHRLSKTARRWFDPVLPPEVTAEPKISSEAPKSYVDSHFAG